MKNFSILKSDIVDNRHPQKYNSSSQYYIHKEDITNTFDGIPISTD